MSGPTSLLRLCLLSGLGLASPLASALLYDDSANSTTPDLDTDAPSAPVITVPASAPVPLSFVADHGVVDVDLATQIAEKVEVTDKTDAGAPITSAITFVFNPTGNIGPLLPGRHTISWLATDLGGNTATTNQTIDIVPLVDFAPNQTVGEGGTARVKLLLNGTAPSYPVTVNYTIGGSNSGGGADNGINDHSLSGATGSFVFNDGETEKLQEIQIYADGDSGEGETLTLTIDEGSLPTSQVSVGHQKSHTITITEQPLAPRADLSASQGSHNGQNILVDGGEVTISANTYDGNGDTVYFDWSASDNALSPISGSVDSQFKFDPSSLAPGYYTVRLTINDDSGMASAHHLQLRVLANDIELSADDDSDDDGLDNLSEGIDDQDHDNIPDYLDAVSRDNQIQTTDLFIFDSSLIHEDSLAVDSMKLDWSLTSSASRRVFYPLQITTEPGLKLSVGPTAFATGQPYAKISSHAAEVQRGIFISSDLVSNDGQVFDIEIDQLANQGDLVKLIIPQTIPLTGTALNFYSFNSINQWQVFVAQNGDEIKTATKLDGFCPNLSNTASYSGTLTAGAECVLLTVRDGGPNDYDGLVNGSIDLMGGIFFHTNSPAQYAQESESFVEETETTYESLETNNLGKGDAGKTGRAASASWLSLLAIGGLLLWRRRQ